MWLLDGSAATQRASPPIDMSEQERSYDIGSALIAYMMRKYVEYVEDQRIKRLVSTRREKDKRIKAHLEMHYFEYSRVTIKHGPRRHSIHDMIRGDWYL
jgi:hypothetical protein